MKKVIFMLSLLLLVACSNKEEKVESSLLVENGKEAVEFETIVIEDKKNLRDIRGKTFSNNSKDKYYFTFLEKSLIITIPQFAIEKELSCKYYGGAFEIELFTGTYLQGKSKEEKLTSVESFFIFKILDSISQEDNYIDKENHKALFTYTYILNEKNLKINPNSANQVILTLEEN